MSLFKRIAPDVASTQDRMIAERDIVPDVRRRFVEEAALISPPRKATRRIVVGAGVLLAASLAVLFLLPKTETITLEGVDRTVGAGEWISAPIDAEQPIRFSDGSRVTLSPGSSARVTELNRRGASLLLEGGAARVEVTHRPDTRWRLDVGPFAVRVIGTVFDVSWDLKQQVFSLALVEGTVSVSGPLVPDGRRIARGETLRVWLAEKRLETTQGDTATLAVTEARSEDQKLKDPSSNGSLPEEKESADKELSPRQHAPATPGVTRETAAWENAARRGQWREAIDSAEEFGFMRIARNAPAKKVMLLANTARLSGEIDRAELAYTTVRERFPGSSHAATAAFNLGRIHFDHRKSYSQAIHWLERTLADQPSGTLSREAQGRLIEAYFRAGKTEKATELAQDYLAKYPSGPHARFARSLLDRH